MTGHVLGLDDYEVVNLREGLILLRALGCDTGDWLGQILAKLPPTPFIRPNVVHEEQVERVQKHVQLLSALDEIGGEPA